MASEVHLHVGDLVLEAQLEEPIVIGWVDVELEKSKVRGDQHAVVGIKERRIDARIFVGSVKYRGWIVREVGRARVVARALELEDDVRRADDGVSTFASKLPRLESRSPKLTSSVTSRVLASSKVPVAA
jgi:hypothetical protein